MGEYADMAVDDAINGGHWNRENLYWGGTGKRRRPRAKTPPSVATLSDFADLIEPTPK